MRFVAVVKGFQRQNCTKKRHRKLENFMFVFSAGGQVDLEKDCIFYKVDNDYTGYFTINASHFED